MNNLLDKIIDPKTINAYLHLYNPLNKLGVEGGKVKKAIVKLLKIVIVDESRLPQIVNLITNYRKGEPVKNVTYRDNIGRLC